MDEPPEAGNAESPDTGTAALHAHSEAGLTPMLSERLVLLTPVLSVSGDFRSSSSEVPTESKRIGHRNRRLLLDAEAQRMVQCSLPDDGDSHKVMDDETAGRVDQATSEPDGGAQVMLATNHPGRKRAPACRQDGSEAASSWTEESTGLETSGARKKWRRELRTATVTESLGASRPECNPNASRLERAKSSLAVLDGTTMTPPRRPVLERRQLSATTADAMTAVHTLALPTIRSMDHPDLNVISPETVRIV